MSANAPAGWWYALVVDKGDAGYLLAVPLDGGYSILFYDPHRRVDPLRDAAGSSLEEARANLASRHDLESGEWFAIPAGCEDPLGYAMEHLSRELARVG